MKSVTLTLLAVAFSSGFYALHAETPAPPPNWKTSQPSKTVGNSDWWTVFGDATLSRMIAEAQSHYPGLQGVLARVDQARAAVRSARSGWFPVVMLNGDAGRSRASATTFSFSPGTLNNFGTSAELNYEFDLWGKVRGQVNAARADEAGANADAQVLGLVLAGEVARIYFTLRSVDEERDVLEDTLNLRHEALDMAAARVEAGATNELDRVRAEAELAGTEAELAALAGPRAELENTMALALGKVASDYKVPVAKNPETLPAIPKVLPADLVQRRPDVASAMRKVEAAQQRVGVARTTFFPKVMLGAAFGTATSHTRDYFDRESEAWSFGLKFSVPLFVGGQRKATVDAARATLREVTGTYEEKVLTAFKEVESLMARIASQQTQSTAQERLQTAAQAAAKLARQRYKEGVAPYLEVIEAERTALSARRALVQLRGQRLVTTVQLIQALGGGWIDTNPPKKP